MRHIRQRFKNDCSIATAAMRLGLSYREVRNAKHYNHEPYGCDDADFLTLLKDLSGYDWEYQEIEDSPYIYNYKPNKEPKILAITREGKKGYHLIYTDGRYYYDPDELYPVSINAARKNPVWCEWYVTHEVLPVTEN